MSLRAATYSAPWGARLRVFVALLGCFVLAGGCGVGGSTSTTEEFYLQAIGPNGGVAQAGPVTLTVPPGALPQLTSVAILPELTPIPIQAPQFDPCTYGYLGPIHCCGPIALMLDVAGTLRVAYDPGLIPAGYTENDLVLLTSDNQTGFMIPRTGPNVIQNQALNYFEDTVHVEFAHVAIGIRTCPQGRILVANNPVVNPKPEVAQGRQVDGADLYIVDPEELALPAFVDTLGLNFRSFLASPSGDRVLLAASDPMTESSTLFTLPLPAGGSSVAVFASQQNLFLQGFDPFYGWLDGAPGDQVFALFYHPTAQPTGLAGPLNTYELHRRDALAAQPAVEVHERDANLFFPNDLRQWGQGLPAGMLRWDTNFYEQVLEAAAIVSGAVDVVDPPSATTFSEGQIQPNSFGTSPRFMTSSSDLYVISNGSTVERWERDGSFVGTLFDPGFESGEVLIDFALAPDDETFAMVVDVTVFIGGLEQQGFTTIQTELWMGTLTDGVQATFSYFSQQSVSELVWHPDQTGVFLDMAQINVGFYRLLDGKGLFIDETLLPVPGMELVDVNRTDGRILMLVQSFFLAAPNAGNLVPGLYVGPSDASEFGLVTMPDLDDPVQARWIESWRHQPGMDGPRVR